MNRVSALKAQPWRFQPGDLAYVSGWPANESVKVTAQIATGCFPEYLVVDSAGEEWHVAQLRLSSKPIGQEPLLPLFAHAVASRDLVTADEIEEAL